MKVLHIINSLATGGAEKLIVETIPLLNNQGIETDVLLLNGTEYPLYHELKKKYSGNIYSLGKGSVYSPKHIGKIIPYLKKYDLVHVHLFPAQYFAVAAKRLSFSKVPMIFTEHSTSNRRFRSKWFRLSDKIVYSSYNKIICITEKVKSAVLEKTGISKDVLIIIENGVDLKKINTATNIPRNTIHKMISESDFLLLQVSSFQYPKDQPTLIHALQHLPQQVKLLLAGEGPLRKECENITKELQLQDRVFFLGIRNDIPQLLKTVDAVVLSSHYEGLSLSSLEGMASGKPFLASDVPGLSEVVGGAGILFPQGDSKNLAEEIKKLIVDTYHYEKVVEQCTERAARYDIVSMVDKTVLLYKTILSKEN